MSDIIIPVTLYFSCCSTLLQSSKTLLIHPFCQNIDIQHSNKIYRWEKLF